jgi:hypothetical protein
VNAGVWGDAVGYAAGTALLSLVATRLMLDSPRPGLFVGGVMVLVAAGGALASFVLEQSLAARFVTAGLGPVLGIAIGSRVAGSALAAARSVPARTA